MCKSPGSRSDFRIDSSNCWVACSSTASAISAKKPDGRGRKAIVEVIVTNSAIANLSDTYDIVVTHQDLTDRARQRTPSAEHVSVDNFMNSPRYDEVVDLVKAQHEER